VLGPDGLRYQYANISAVIVSNVPPRAESSIGAVVVRNAIDSRRLFKMVNVPRRLLPDFARRADSGAAQHLPLGWRSVGNHRRGISQRFVSSVRLAAEPSCTCTLPPYGRARKTSDARSRGLHAHRLLFRCPWLVPARQAGITRCSCRLARISR